MPSRQLRPLMPFDESATELDQAIDAEEFVGKRPEVALLCHPPPLDR